MAKQEFDINSLRIAAPCQVGWDTMTGDERKRFCDLCSLNVYNISEMTRPQVETLVGNADGRICMRMYRRADGTVMTKDCPVGLRAYRKRAATYVSAAFGAILGLFSVGFGQSKTDAAAPLPKITIEKAVHLSDKSILTGTAADEPGAIIAGATVTITDINKGTYVTKSDSAGHYIFPELPPGTYKITIEFAGFETFNMDDLFLAAGEKTIVDSVLKIDNNDIVGQLEILPPGPNIDNLILIAPTQPKKP
jgi:hypothetical protein